MTASALDRLREAKRECPGCVDNQYCTECSELFANLIFPSLWEQCFCGGCTDTRDDRSPYCDPDTGLVPRHYDSDLEAVGPVLKDWMKATDEPVTRLRLEDLENPGMLFDAVSALSEALGWLKGEDND